MSLPPRNPRAFQLCITDAEFEELNELLEANSQMIEAAWIYGSRHSGSRKDFTATTRPDIDIAVQPRASDNEDVGLIEFELRHRLRKFLAERSDYHLLTPTSNTRIHIEYYRDTVRGYVDQGCTRIR